MKKFCRFLSLALGLLILSYQVQAQLKPEGFDPAGKLIPKSPEAAALIKFIDVPVSHYTGIPAIDIPITSIKEGPLELPVSMSYHASGHKVNEYANWVGLGWKLNAEGMITRKINGITDDADIGIGFLEFRDMYSYDNEDSQPSVKDWLLASDESKFTSLASGCWDSQPDEFYFNVNGIQGKFAFGWANGSDPVISSNQDVKIVSYSTAPNSNEIIEWQLAGPDGTIYVFNELETTTVYNMFSLSSPCNSGIHNYTSGWYLTKVMNPYNNAQYLELEYDNYSLQQDWMGYETRSYKMTYSSQCSEALNGSSDFSQSRVDINGKRLKRIKTSSGSFNLYLNANTARTDVNQTFPGSPVLNRLDEIVLKNKVNQIQTRHLLDYYSVGRLQLKSIQEKGKSNTLLPPYEFTYDSRNMPANTSKSVDHWGFYNGSTNSTMLPAYLHILPGNNNYVYYAGSDREPDLQYSRAALMTSLKQPTGAVTEFEYELNDYGYIMGSTVEAQLQYEVVTAGSATSAYNNTSSTTWVTNESAFTINQGNAIVTASISGTTYCTFAGHIYLPKIRIEDANTGALIKEWRLEITPGSQANSPPYQSFHENIVMLPGSYKLICQTKKFINSSGGDGVSASLSWEDINPAAPLLEKNAGGVRVREIRVKDIDGELEAVRRFEYDMPDGRSSGVVYDEPRYVYTGAHLGGNGVECNYIQVIGSSNVILGATSGSHIGYRQVTEYQGVNGENGKIVYEFTSPYNYGDQLNYSRPYAPPRSNSFKTGLSDKTTYYKKSGSSYSPVKEQDYEYHFKQYDIKSAKVSFGRISPPLFSGLVTGSAYATYPFYDKFAQAFIDMRIGHVQIKKITEKEFYGTNTVSRVKEFAYDANYHHETEMKTTNSDGTQYINRKHYPDDLPGGGSSSIAQALVSLRSLNIVNVPIEEMTYIKKIGESEKLVYAKFTEYKMFSGNPLPYRSWTTEVNNPVTDFVPAYLSSGGTLIKSFYYKNNTIAAPDGQITSYDGNGNIRQFNKYYDQPTSLIWGHESSTPVAMVVNASNNEVAFTSFEDAKPSQGGWSYSNSGIWNSSAAFAGKKHRYLSYGAISKSSVPPGKYLLSFYGWYSNASIKVNGTTVGTTNSSSSQRYYEFELNLSSSSTVQISGSGYIDELRLHPADAMMTTYTYDDDSRKILAIGNENQVHTHYTYDEFYRLRLIKDQDKYIFKSYEYDYQSGSGTQNIIKTQDVQINGNQSISQINALSGADVRRGNRYFDGLGRIIQGVQVKQSPAQKDMVVISEYDAFGREHKTYLPYTYTSTNGSSMHSDAIDRQNDFYYGLSGSTTARAYIEKEFEPSPLNRVLMERPQGHHFYNHPVEFSYRTNTANEVRYFNNGISTGHFAANTLYVTEREDENNNSIIVYTDQLGREVMTDREGAQTYKIYNDFNEIEAVLSPEVSNTMATSNNWDYNDSAYDKRIYKYTYDSRRRLIKKEMPGAATQEFRYDLLDRVRLETDGNLLSDGKWKYTKYDILSRPVQSGIYSGNYPSAYYISGAFYESRNSSTHSYTNNSFPTSSAGLRMVLFYDDYDLDGDNIADSWEQYKSPTVIGYNSINFARVRNKETANKVGVLKPDGSTPTQWLYNQTFYDDSDRIIQTRNDNHLNEEDVIFTAYDFADRITKTRRENKAVLGATKTINIDKSYTYDHAGRLLNTYQSINGSPQVLLSKQRYNELDQLSERKLHQASSGYFLQDVDYSYNIRGWLTKINSFSCSNGTSSSGSTSMVDKPNTKSNFGELRNAGLIVHLGSQGPRVELNAELYQQKGQKANPLNLSSQLQLQGEAKKVLSQPQRLEINLSDLTINESTFAASLLTIEDRIAEEMVAKGLKTSPAPIIAQVQQLLEQRLSASTNSGGPAESSLPITIGGGDSPDLFSLQLNYNTSNSNLSAGAYYNGNISSMIWKVGCNDRQAYGMTYDNKDRMTKAYYAEINNSSGSYMNFNRYTVDIVQYDLNGNLKRLRRRGPISSSSYTYIDYLLYTYNGDQLASIRDVYYYRNKGFEAPAYGYKTYSHDDSGNLSRDNHRNANMTYNYHNLPIKVDYDNNNWIAWTYDARGNKLKKEISTGSVKHYMNGIEYNGNCLESVFHNDGRLTPEGDACANNITNWQYEYAIRDHLGNTRVMFADLNNNGEVTAAEIIQEDHYYPFGMNMEGSWAPTVGLENAYQYNGKELNEDFGLNWSDYGARFYDAAIGRWHSVDALAEHPNQIDKSPYAYAWNNPIALNDPDGNCPRCFKAFGKTILKSIAKGKLDLSEVVDIIDATTTLLSKDASLLERGEALFNLASPVSTKEIKAVSKLVDGAGDVKKTKKEERI